MGLRWNHQQSWCNYGSRNHQKQGPEKPCEEDSKKLDLRDIYSHFKKLSHRFITPSTGKEQTHWTCVCIYCKNAYEKEVQEGCIIPRPKKPVEIPRYRETCILHLKGCKSYSNQEKLRSVVASSQVPIHVPKVARLLLMVSCP